MRRKSYRSTWTLALALLLLFALPGRYVSRSRGALVATLGPLWQQLASTAPTLLKGEEEEVARLRAENQLLRDQLLRASDLQRLQSGLLLHIEELHAAIGLDEEEAKGSIHRRIQEVGRLLQLELEAVPANVIYREPVAWNHSLWIDVGRLDNLSRKGEPIAKGSPVVVGESLVGIIDYVGRRQSRVRLITDRSLHPSVRAVRGSALERRVCALASELEEVVRERPDLLSSPLLCHSLLEGLSHLKSELNPSGVSLYLAKGELLGSKESVWRTGSERLRGVGFQYDFRDEEGPARDLRTGEGEGGEAPTPLVELGDLLVTTGMDGCFPRGLLVGRVVSIAPLREGAYGYELELLPTAAPMDQLSSVLVLPPIEFDRGELFSAVR